MKDKDGGAAFPSLEEVGSYNSDEGKYTSSFLPVGGMSLRDYFAVAALQGMLSACNGVAVAESGHMEKWAYQHADAMLEARK